MTGQSCCCYKHLYTFHANVIMASTLNSYFSFQGKALPRTTLRSQLTTLWCRYMLHNIWRICPLVTQKAAQVLVQALVISRLDYCNSLLAGLPGSAMRPLQLIRNAAAWLFFILHTFSHTTPLPSLVTSGCPYPLQDTSTCLPCYKRIRSSMHSGHG